MSGGTRADRTSARSSLARLVRISRPRFWLYLGGTYLVGHAAGVRAAASLADPGALAAVAWFLLPANLFLYGVNDLADGDTDAHNPKKEEREHRLAPRERRPLAAAAAVAAAGGLLLAGWLGPRAVPWMGAFLALGAAYSLPPARLKARPILDSASNVLYAVPGFMAYSLASGALPPVAAVVGAWCWTAGMHLLSAVPDVAADRLAGLSTSATLLGRRPALVAVAILWAVAAVAAGRLAGPAAGAAALAYPLAAIALAARPAALERAYWWFPPANAAAGLALFLVAIAG